ncbi:MAG: hypothetical protein NZT61_00865 [Deltaproteobacteria bacterium]|nr:hypothetical protein [Deltaproteobacteria bacterium]MCX7953312.1 hypothetical protein [Deltaproteobacteria bacterium]
MKAALLFLFVVLISETPPIYVVKRGKQLEILETLPRKKIDGYVEIIQSAYGLEVSPYRKINSSNIQKCPINRDLNMTPEVYNNLVELAKKRLERRKLLDQKLRLLLTDDFIKKLNSIERKYNLKYPNPISRSIDAFELANRVAVILAVLAN